MYFSQEALWAAVTMKAPDAIRWRAGLTVQSCSTQRERCSFYFRKIKGNFSVWRLHGFDARPTGHSGAKHLNTGCSCAHLSLVPHLPLQTDVCFWHAADMWLEILLPRPPSGCLGWEQGKDTASELSGIMLSAQWQDLPTPSVSDWEVAGGISTVSPLLCLWHWDGTRGPHWV